MSEPLAHHASLTRPKTASTEWADQLAPIARPVLRGAVRGVMAEARAFSAAELWLLDDDSQSLSLITRWAHEASNFADGPAANQRRLIDAPADVAALAGGAVVLEQPSDALGWELVDPAPAAAICVPVCSDKTIHGVLWLLGDSQRKIPDSAVELCEIIAGRLALEVERLGPRGPVAKFETREEVATDSVKPSAGEPQRDWVDSFNATLPLPNSATIAPVEAAAWSAPHCEGLSSAGCWELTDGRLLSFAAAAIDSPESSTTSQQAAIEWLNAELPLVAYRSHDAGDLLTQLNRNLIDSPLAGEGIAVAAAIVETPEDAASGVGGIGTYAVAGPAVALSIRAASTDSHAGELIPLGWLEPDSVYAPRPFELAVRGRLILTAGDPRLTSPLVERQLGDAFRAATSDAHRAMTAENCLHRLISSGADDVLAAVALRRD